MIGTLLIYTNNIVLCAAILQGCREEHKGDGFQYDQPDWVPVTNSNYSYTRMTIHNFTHVTFQQISVDLV